MSLPKSGSVSKTGSAIQKARNYLKSFFQRKTDFWDEVEELGWMKEPNSQKLAVQWLREIAAKQRYSKQILLPARLYLFNYDHPKYEKDLDYFDTQPLVLVIRFTDDLREVGINLHLLPPRVRILVLNQLFMMHHSRLKKSQKETFELSWKEIKKILGKYGVDFAIRKYIPKRRKETVEFSLDQWPRAIFIPSKGYKKITPSALEALWRAHTKKSKI